MSPSSPTSGPERLLVLDTGSGPARWVLATFHAETDTTSAQMEAGGRRYSGPGWIAATRWVRTQLGVAEIRLVPVAAVAWRVDPDQPR